MATKRKVKRKAKFVDSRVQGALMRRVLLHWFTFVLVAMLGGACLQIFANPLRTFTEHYRAVWSSQGPLLIVIVLLLPSFAWDIVTLSHRFAGPMFRLAGAIRQAANGQRPEPIELRAGDFWKDVVADFNRMVERLPETPSQRENTQQASNSDDSPAEPTPFDTTVVLSEPVITDSPIATG